MTSKCVGCGVELQIQDQNQLGYANSLDSLYCKRCYRIKHYGDYSALKKRGFYRFEILLVFFVF